MKRIFISLFAVMIIPIVLQAQKKKKTQPEVKKELVDSGTFSGLKFRNIGPALTSGRIADFAVNPDRSSTYYVAVASGGVWKTDNAGTTWKPVFDGQGSYSIGCITLDPNNSEVVWVGTGENNNQRSVAYGDGVYKSVDGGGSWKNMGLKNSEHISKIIVNPSNSDIVYIAAYGPLWSSGGERGVYKTEDGGKTWNLVLEISKDTGVSDLQMDPRDPEVLYAAAHQRRRHVFTYISGGPESALYKTTNGGKDWNKINEGLPSVELGRIGLAVSPVNPDYVYALVEAAEGKDGFFRSTNRGASWEKMSDHTTSGNYYVEIFCDPFDLNRVYSMDMLLMVTDDGGKTFKLLGEKDKHVDNHAMWIDKHDKDHYLAGCDGGVYESFDRGATWDFKANLPVTQFYKVSVDNAYPFYNIYGGTQDNYSLGGPSRTLSVNGIVNADWFVTKGGDGFESVIDPKDPNIVYAQSQYGWLARYDKASGEKISIRPVEGPDDPPYRWNWDAPLLVSAHAHTRLFFAANKVFRSDDRGNSWKEISPDLTRQIDRNILKVMGKVWSVDAVAKNKSTTIYGNIVALSESPVKEDIIYAGTDDGLIQVTENGGGDWRKISSFPGVPDTTYVNCIIASLFEEDRVYAAFNNHKRGDFKPYVLRSEDGGRTWKSIASNLPPRGSVYALAEDHVNPDLLFAGTEFGLFFTVDGGKKWIQLKAGLPTIAIRDIDVQRRDNDLVLASFGRGFYVLDDYAPLREIDSELIKKEAHIFSLRKTLMYMPATPVGGDGKGFQGSSWYTAENPPFGAAFTWYLKDEIDDLKKSRRDAEKKLEKEGKPVAYPSFEEMREEDREESPYLLFTVKDIQRNVVTRIKTKPSKGIHRMTWNLRYASRLPVRSGGISKPGEEHGHMVLPGVYTVTMSKYVNGTLSQLAGPEPFEAVSLGLATLKAEDREMVIAFQGQVAELQRATQGTSRYIFELKKKLKLIKIAIRKTPALDESLLAFVKSIEEDLEDINVELNGDVSLEKRFFPIKTSVNDRIGAIAYGLWNTTSAPTTTMKDSYKAAVKAFKPLLERVKKIADEDVKRLEDKLDAAHAPYTPGRLPEWE